jgi:hypothetical protein
MATVDPVWATVSLPNSSVYGDGKSSRPILAAYELVTVTWADVDGGDTCTATPAGWLVDKSVQISGTTITSVACHGSNDNVEYFVLNDPQGNALTGINSEKIEQLLEATLYFKPVVTTGTDVDVILFGRIPVV